MASIAAALPQIGLSPASPTGSGDQDTFFPQEAKQPLPSETAAAAIPPASLVGAPATTTITTPSGGSGDSTGGVYVPGRPNLLSLNTQSSELQKLFKAAYTPDDSIKRPPANSDQEANDAVQHGQDFLATQAQKPPPSDSTISLSDTNRAIGNATTFGLDYNSGDWDEQDNGKGAFGYNTRDPNLEGASLPISVIKSSIGDYTKDPKIYAAIKRGDYQVNVTGPDGTSRIMHIVDAGPAEWTGNALDLTYKSSHDFNTNGKAKLGYQIIGPDGNPIPIKGFHPDSTSRTSWLDHIGPKVKPIPAGPTEPVKPEPIPAGPTKPAKPVPIEDMGEKPKTTTIDNTVTREGATTTVNGKPVTPTKSTAKGKGVDYTKYAVPVEQGGYLKPDGTLDEDAIARDKGS
jgi:hypothetical protein